MEKKATLVLSTVKLFYQLPADKKSPVREIHYSTRRRKEVTKRLEYQAQTSKSVRHRNCRAKLRVLQTTCPGHCQPQQYRSLNQPYSTEPSMLLHQHSHSVQAYRKVY